MSQILTKYRIYNSLFLSLPFKGIAKTGTLLPLFSEQGAEGLAAGHTPVQIVEDFFREYLEEVPAENRMGLLFQFIQYVERQVVLFDAVEDSAFEENHDMDGKGSVKFMLQQLDSEKSRAELIEKLQEYSVRLTLTAHPTQFYPGKVLGIIGDLSQAIREGDLENIDLLLSQLGKTAFVNREKPTPYDEAVSLGWFLENVFYEALPKVVFRLLSALQIDVTTFPNPNLLAIGFWPGGDRDGNPFVTADITLKVASRMREAILRCYYRDVRQLRRRLTFAQVEEIMQAVERKIYATLYSRDGENAEIYTDAQAMLDDLLSARKVLLEQHDGLFLDKLDEYILKLRMFGFRFSSMDIRQDSSKHAVVWKQILEKTALESPGFSLADFHSSPENAQIDFLLSMKQVLKPEDFEDVFTQETLRSVLAIRQIQAENGPKGCHRYIISNCQSALHVLEVFTMVRLVWGLPEADSAIPLDISPLFETIDDLAVADSVMQTLYENPIYRAHLQRRGNIQHIMLGFSDGTKDGGYLRANWSIFRAKENLTAISRKNGIQVIFFDGRGGPPGRGGGNAAAFYASLGPQIENKEIHITIQGQTVSSNYGTLPTAVYNMERLFTAGLENQLFSKNTPPFKAKEKALLDDLADSAYKAYLDLKNDPKFVPYLEKMTPLKWFGDTNIASRPTKRNQDAALRFEDLRAIPFVGAWAQMKQNISGFYGVGSAVNDLKSKKKGAEVRALYKNSPFFRSLIENSMQSLSKSNFELTRYIAHHPEFGDFWQKIYTEYQRTLHAISELEEKKTLLNDNPNSRLSIGMREEIVLPLILIQQYALQKLQTETNPQQTELLKKLVLRAMFGIINAARNAA